MGAASNPISAVTQKLEKGVSGKPTALGTATFKFDSPPAGTTWTGTLTCSDAPSTAVFTATVGGTSWGSWGGNSVFGPIQVQGQGAQQLVITATGLALSTSTTYEIWMLGSSDDTSNVAPIWPDATSSALTAQINGSVTLNTASTLIAQGGAAITTAFTSIYNVTLTQTFTSFCVIVGGDVTLGAVSVSLANGTTGQSHNLQSSPGVGMIAGNLLPSENNRFYFPVSVAAGQTLQVYWKSQVASADVYSIIGFPAYPSTFVQTAPNTLLATRDGGGLLGAYSPSPQLHGVFYTLLAAATNGYCYRLWTYGANSTFAPATGAFQLADAVGAIAGMSFPMSTANTVNSGSIHLNGALTVGPVTTYWLNGVAASTGGSYLRYDTIPRPSFSGVL